MLLRGSIRSNALEKDTNITVFAPNESKSGKPCQAAYLLHGLSGCSGDWADCSRLASYAEEYDAFVVMPDADRSFYCDMKYGQNYFSYVALELPELVKRYFNVSAAREDTVIMGCSMGGFGALKSALTYPERFGTCCVFSAASLFFAERSAGMTSPEGRMEVLEKYGQQIYRDFQGIFGLELVPGEENEMTALAEKAAASGMRPKIYSACGRDDPFRADNVRFAGVMKELGYDFSYEEWPGEHDWDFFDAALKKALRFCFGS